MLCALGLVVLRFSALEWCAERLLAGFISDSELVMLIVAGQDMSWKLDRLRQVNAELVQTDATAALDGWADGAEKLNSRRNLLIHAVWSTSPEGVPIGFRVQKRGKWNLRPQPVTAYMLAEFLAQITSAIGLAVTISADLSGHPQWKGHPLDEALSTADRVDHEEERPPRSNGTLG